MEGPPNLAPKATNPLDQISEIKSSMLNDFADAAYRYVSAAQHEGITLVFTYGVGTAGPLMNTNCKRARELVEALQPLDAAGIRDVIGLAAAQLNVSGAEGNAGAVTYTFPGRSLR